MNATNLKLYHSPEVTWRKLNSSDETQDGNEAQVNPDKPQNDPEVPQNTPGKAINDNAESINGNNPSQGRIVHDKSKTQNKPSRDPNTKYTLKDLHGCRLRNGHRQTRVEWSDGTRTWEPDASFDPDLLNEINQNYTKHGKKKSSCFKRKRRVMYVRPHKSRYTQW